MFISFVLSFLAKINLLSSGLRTYPNVFACIQMYPHASPNVSIRAKNQYNSRKLTKVIKNKLKQTQLKKIL